MFDISKNILMLLVIVITKITINFINYFKNDLKGRTLIILIYDYF